MRFFVLPYTSASRSAKDVAEALPDGKRLRRENSEYRPRTGDLIINWGKLKAADYLPRLPDGVKLLNHDTRITDKLAFFTALTRAGKGAIIPRFWSSQAAIPDDAFPVFCRTTGDREGRGITIAENRAGLVPAPLYVQYIENVAEYRVHMGKTPDGGTVVIGTQQKKHRNNLPWGETRIRHLQNGYIYIGQFEQQIDPAPQHMYDAVREAFLVTNLDFGAFDVIVTRDASFVLEVNTAPGLEGSDIQNYANFFRSLVGAEQEEPVVAARAEPLAAAPAAPAPEPVIERPVAEPVIREAAEPPVMAAAGNREYTIVMGVSLEAREVTATVQAASLEEAARLVRQNVNNYLGRVQPVVDVTSVSLNR